MNHLTNWIWTPDWTPEDTENARIVLFRVRMDLCAKPEFFPVRITADTRYKLYVNGHLAEYGPSRGDLHIWYLDEVDLAPWLSPGENIISAAVLRYPADVRKGNHGMFRTKNPGLYIEGVQPDTWRCRTDRLTSFYAEDEQFAPLQIHEHAAGDPETSGWMETGYDDSSWEPAFCYAREQLPEVLLPERLVPRTIPYMFRNCRHFTLPESEIPARSEKSFVLDAGEELCTFLRLEMSGGAGAKVELLQSECYVTEHGKENRLDPEHGHLEGYTDTYTVSGKSTEVYAPYWFRTFRFLKITVRTHDEPLQLLALEGEDTGYPLETRAEAATSDESLADIWDISLRTLRRCMQETYTDCPFYEQLQYAMDTRSQILYTYAISMDDRLARKAIDDFSRALRPDGMINCSYPNMTVNVIPGFSIYYILMIHDHMMYFGDRELVKRYLPAADRILQFFASHRTPGGLVDKVGGVNGLAPYWSFIDWAEEWMPTQGMPAAGLRGPLTMESLLLLLGLRAAAELADFAEDDRASGYRQQAEALSAAIRKHCMREDGMLTDGPGAPELSQHAQVFGILSGVLTPEEGRRNLLYALDTPGIARCSVAMCFYLFRALEITGLYSRTDSLWEIWRDMVRNGCSTCVEAENFARSECHAWGALALYELPSVILGVRPAAPGYEKIRVAPVPGALTHASGRVPTPWGELRVAWKKQGDHISLHIDGDPEALRRIRHA